MQLKELESIKYIVHCYLIASLTQNTLSYDLENIKRVVKIAQPYESFIQQQLNILQQEILGLRQEFLAFKISNTLPSRDVDEYIVEYTIVAKGEEHKVRYSRTALKNHVTRKLHDLLNPPL